MPTTNSRSYVQHGYQSSSGCFFREQVMAIFSGPTPHIYDVSVYNGATFRDPEVCVLCAPFWAGCLYNIVVRKQRHSLSRSVASTILCFLYDFFQVCCFSKICNAIHFLPLQVIYHSTCLSCIETPPPILSISSRTARTGYCNFERPKPLLAKRTRSILDSIKMCWGEKVENHCPIDHSVETIIRWFGCQYGQNTHCPNPFLVPHQTNTLCTNCLHESDFANSFHPSPPSPSRDWEAFKRDFRHTHTPTISPSYITIPSPSLEVPTMIQSLPGADNELPSYALTMQETPSPPTWSALYSHHPYTLGHATAFATHRLETLYTTTRPLYRRLQRLRPALVPGTQTSTTVTHIHQSLLHLESTAEANLQTAQELEQHATTLALSTGFMVSFELQQAFLHAEFRGRYLYLQLLDDDDDDFGDAGTVGRRFEAWIGEVEVNGEFRRRGGRMVDETTPLLPRVVRGSFVDVVGWDFVDLGCVVGGAVVWFAVLWVLWFEFA